MASSLLLRDRYRLDGVLGEGGQAIVLRAYDQRLDVPRALKVMLPSAAKRSSQRGRFVAEARLLARIEHPNVVRVYDVEEVQPCPFFVAELVTGGSLHTRLRRAGPLGPRTTAAIVTEICDGLAAAHAAGAVHRDVKPHNVLLTPGGACKVVDFGIAHLDTVARTRAGVTMGTEGFMPPEQFSDAASVDVRADVYGVAMTAYVLLTGRDPVEWLGGHHDGVPDGFLGVLTAGTQAERDRRIGSVRELADRLAAAAASLPPDAPAPPLAMEGSLDDASLAGKLPEVISWYTRLSDEGPQPKPSPSTPVNSLAPVSGYVMSRPRRDSAPPAVAEYAVVDEAPLVRGFDVALQEDEISASIEARTRRMQSEDRSPHPPPPAEARPAPPALAPAWSVAHFVLPGSLVLLAASLVLGGGAVYVWDHRAEVRRQEVRGVREALAAAVKDQVSVFGTLESMGSDPDALSALLTTFERARDDEERTRAALEIVDHVRAETQRLAEPGSAQRARLDQQTLPLVEAADRVRSLP